MYPFLQSLEKFGINLGLDRINYLLKRLGNPQNKFQSIHIAGTNGKGSTAAVAASILKESGHKVGLYTSPHLFDFTERVKVNGKDISKAEFNKGLKLIEKIVKRQKEKPTIFEVLTALAFWYFARKKVKYAVVETGLGGRLDATNVLNPLVTIITNIDYEHVEILGRTLENITQEKAGIIKPKTAVVTAENRSGLVRIIKRTCDDKKCTLVQVQEEQPELVSGLFGPHQKLNAACAISAIRLASIKLTPKAIEKGIKNVKWPGRFQVLKKKPLIILDGAHNPAGAKALRVTINHEFPHKYTIIFGCQERKDFENIVRELEPITQKVIITKSSHKLAADPRYLYNHFRRHKNPMSVTFSVKEAVKEWDRKSPLLISGSLFVVAEGLKLLSR